MLCDDDAVIKESFGGCLVNRPIRKNPDGTQKEANMIGTLLGWTSATAGHLVMFIIPTIVFFRLFWKELSWRNPHFMVSLLTFSYGALTTVLAVYCEIQSAVKAHGANSATS